MANTVPRGTINWDGPLNDSLSNLDSRVSANRASIGQIVSGEFSALTQETEPYSKTDTREMTITGIDVTSKYRPRLALVLNGSEEMHVVSSSYTGGNTVVITTEDIVAVSLTSLQTGLIVQANADSKYPRVATPSITSPTEGQTDFAPLQIVGTEYGNVYGTSRSTRTAQVSTTSDFAVIVSQNSANSDTVLIDYADLEVSTLYYVRMFDTDVDGNVSFFSDPVSFTTPSSFNAWPDFDDTLSSSIATFLSDLPSNLSATKITDTCSLASCRVGAALTQVGVALTRASAASIDFTAASPFNVSTVNVNNNGLSSVTRLDDDWALFFYDPDINLDAAVAVRAVEKGVSESIWSASGTGIALSGFGYIVRVQATELNDLGSACVYRDERSAGVVPAVVSEITRPTNTSNVLSKTEIFVGSENNSDQTAIVSMSENELIFAYSYGGPPFAVKLYSATRPDSGTAWGTAQLLTSYESLTNAPQYLEVTKMSADRFVLSYYEGDLADDRVRGKVFNRVGETWTVGNEFLTTSGSDAVRPKLTAPRDDTVLIAYGTSNISLEVHTYDGSSWTSGTAVEVFDGTTGQKDLVFLSEDQVLALFQKTTAPVQGNMKTLVAG